MSTCRADGTVLKPDKPLTIADDCFARAEGAAAIDACFVYHTYSDIPGIGRVHYHFNNDKNEPITPPMLNINSASNTRNGGGGMISSYVVYNWYSREVSALDANGTTIAAGYEDHTYAIVAPITGAWAFVGETNKYVTAASIRFTSVTPSASNGLSVQVVGVAGETVQVCAVKAADLSLECSSIKFDAAGTRTLSFPLK
jgi:hypothetical protein